MFRVTILAFIDAFAKFREATVSIVMSVRPHVHPQEQLGTTWTVFFKSNLIFEVFLKMFRTNSTLIKI